LWVAHIFNQPQQPESTGVEFLGNTVMKAELMAFIKVVLMFLEVTHGNSEIFL